MTEYVDYLTIDDLLEIAGGLIDDMRIRDVGLLESAVARPATVVFGVETYPDFAEKVAALMHAIARNHALIDGNKRLAWAAGRIFCLMNGRDLSLTVDDAEELVLSIAIGTRDVAEIASVLRTAIVAAER